MTKDLNSPCLESESVDESSSTSGRMEKERFGIVRSVGEECIKDEELLNLLKQNPHPICYDGFEPSTKMHIAQGVMKVLNVNKLTSTGCKVKIWIADWFALLNGKMDGDLEKLQTFGRYYIEIWKAAGMNLGGDQVEFIWSSEEVNSQPSDYWFLVMDIARQNYLSDGCWQSRSQEEPSTASVLNPCIQCADMLFTKADICQLGVDQRELSVLAREYCDKIKSEHKPIILLHHMLPGLKEGQEKMSESDPSSAIFMDDDEDVVNLKINNAFCPPSVVEKNPCMEYIKYIVFPWFGEFNVQGREGDKNFKNFEDLVVDYEKGDIHPTDLKPSLSKAINIILKPVREHFENDEDAKVLLKAVKGFTTPKKKIGSLNIMTKDLNSLCLESVSVDESSSTSTSTSGMERFGIVRSVGEECIKDEELLNLLKQKPHPICYDGFEPSGRMHIAQGVMKMLNVNKLTSAGCKVKIWIADWFAFLNGKMDGDLEKIQTLGRFFIEIWKAAGMDLDQVQFLWASEEMNSRPRDYWPLVMDIARRNKLSRITRCCQIMGRKEPDKLSIAQIFYPCMQCADIFFLKADICQLGMDQRKVNVLAREYCNKTKRKDKPIILSHHMLPGLKGQGKMSKSDPSSAIFMDDDEDEVIMKINNAFCPPTVVDENPCMEYIKYIVFPWFGEFSVQLNGGERTFKSFEVLVVDYAKGEIHPSDLKSSLSKAINIILKPIREHFENDEEAKALLKTVKGFTKRKD